MAAIEISVVVPARNAAPTLGEQLRAVLDQGCSAPVELIVADNGSCDGTARLAAELGARVVAATAGRGAAVARNAGARASRGRLLVFVDADDVVSPGYLDAMGAALDRWDLAGARVDQERLNPGGWSRLAGSTSRTGCR